MRKSLLVFADVPQHRRIAATLRETLSEVFDVHLATTVVANPLEDAWPAHDVHRLPPLPRWSERLPRIARILHAGIRRNAELAALCAELSRHGALAGVVVFNDTGVPQRRLLKRAREQGLAGVLVQDGLTETRFRESRRSFRLRLLVTTFVLQPLGLAFLGSTAYGTGGASLVLVDGPASAQFFRERAPRAQVAIVGLLRPGGAHDPACEAPSRREILFWGVDFLGGLQDPLLHELQLNVVRRLAEFLRERAPGWRLNLRVHPGDAAHVDRYRTALLDCGVCVSDPARSPAAMSNATIATLSLQSAGVFDGLAAGLPSWFIDVDGVRLGPAWLPEALVLDASGAGFGEALRRLVAAPADAHAIWEQQVRALESFIVIPFDAAEVLAAFDERAPA